jgi:hypothetical protein
MRIAACIAGIAFAAAGCAPLPTPYAPATPAAVAAASALPATPQVDTVPPPSDTPPPEFGWLGDLVNACWRGDRTESGRGGETFCYMLQYGRMIRAGVKTPVFELEAVFGIDLETRRPVYMQWASNGFISPGDITIEGETLVFINRTAEGVPSKTARSIWSRVDVDTYRVRRETRDEAGGWKEFSTVDYHRVRG